MCLNALEVFWRWRREIFTNSLLLQISSFPLMLILRVRCPPGAAFQQEGGREGCSMLREIPSVPSKCKPEISFLLSDSLLPTESTQTIIFTT